MDALDGTLSAADQAIFDLHLLSCVSCSNMVADAQRGAAWMEMLKFPRPEPSDTLLERILAQTSGQASTAATSSESTSTTPVPFLATTNSLLGRPALVTHSRTLQATSNVLPFRSRIAANFNLRAIGHNLLQPRLAMTAAMAFFSVALTLNLTGVKLSELRASDLRPSNIQRNLSNANSRVVRYYDNLRVVYELESRVHDLQRSSDSDSNVAAPAAPASSTPKPAGKDQPDQNQEQQSKPRPRPGSSRRENPASPGANLQYVVAAADRREKSISTAPSALPILALLSPSFAPSNTDNQLQEGRLV